MSIKKGCGCAAAAAACSLIAGYFILTNSGLQTSIANSVLKDSFGGSSVGSVSIGLGGAEIKNLDFRGIDGASFTAESISAEYSLAALLSKTVEISNASVRGAEFKMLPKAPAAPGAAPEASGGAAPSKGMAPSGVKTAKAPAEEAPEGARFRLPDLSLNIKSADAEAAVELADGSRIELGAQLKSFSARKLALVESADLKVSAGFRMAGLPPESLALAVTVVPSNGARSIKAALERGGKKLVQLSARADAEYSAAEIQARIAADSSDFANILRGAPDFKVDAFADASADAGLKNVRCKASIKADASALERISGALAPLKAVSLSGSVAAEKAGSGISIANAELVLSANGSQILNAKNADAFRLDAGDLSKIPDGDLASITVASLPPELVNAFSGPVKIHCGPISARFTVSKRGRAFAISTDSPLTLPNLSVESGGKVVASRISPTLSLSGQTDLKEASASAELKANPDAGGNLSVSLSLDHKASATDARLAVSGSPSALLPDAKLPQLLLEAAAGASYSGEKAALNSLSAVVRDASGTEILAASMSGKAFYDLASRRPSAEGAALTLSGRDVPFAMFRPFAAGLDAETVSLSARAEMPSPESVRADAEMSVKGMSFAKGGETLLRGLDAAAKIRASLADKYARLDAASVEIYEGTAAALTLKAGASALLDAPAETVRAEVSARAALPLLMSQPAAWKFNNIATGSLEAEARFENGSLNADAALINITARGYPMTVGKASLSVQALFDGLEPKSAAAKLGTFSPLGTGSASIEIINADPIKIGLNAGTVIVDEFETLAAAFTNPAAKDGVMAPEPAGESAPGKKRLLRPAEAAPSAASAPAAAKPAKAPWDFGKSLEFSAKIAEIERMEKTVASGISARAAVSPGEVSLEGFSAKIFGADADASALIMFDPERGYTLKNLSAKVSGLEAGDIMKPNGAGEKMLEGSFSADLSMSGSGSTPADLAENLTGSARLSSSGGTLRLLDKSSTAGAVSSIGSAALKIGGGILGNRVRELGAIGDLTELLSRMDYSKIDISLRRGADLDIEVSSFDIVSDYLMMTASGKIDYDKALGFKDQQIDLPVRLYAREGRTADLFKKIGFATSESSIKGYFDGPQFNISGKISSPENNLLEVISKAAGRSAAGGLEIGAKPEPDAGESKAGSGADAARAISNILKGLSNGGAK